MGPGGASCGWVKHFKNNIPSGKHRFITGWWFDIYRTYPLEMEVLYGFIWLYYRMDPPSYNLVDIP